MGWTSITTQKSFKDVFKNEFSYLEVIKSVFIEANDEDTVQFLTVKHFKGFKFVMVILWQKRDGEVYWKVMDETMGPNTYGIKCPKYIIEAADTIEVLESYGCHVGYTAQWRERNIGHEIK